MIVSLFSCLTGIVASADEYSVTATDGGYVIDSGNGEYTAKAYYGNTFVGWVNADDEVVSYNTTIGAVEGDVTVRRFRKDFADTGMLEVSGTLTLAENPVVEIADVPAKIPAGTLIPIASATAFSGRENFAGVTIIGIPDHLKAHLKIIDDTLYVRFGRGMTLIVR
jgi:hypothetical protein